jgi:hypothetical protein
MLQIKVVPAPPEYEVHQITPQRESTATIVVNAVERGFMKIGVGVCVYVAIDTLRQVIVARSYKS